MFEHVGEYFVYVVQIQHPDVGVKESPSVSRKLYYGGRYREYSNVETPVLCPGREEDSSQIYSQREQDHRSETPPNTETSMKTRKNEGNMYVRRAVPGNIR